jgi:tetratricopeptide (TPR) repeat protein
VSEAVYERYKDALRRGHVAASRGRPEAALAAYVEAASIAPERALPHSSIGTVYLGLGRPRHALAAFAAALERAPRDEPSLAGRAEALLALGRRTEAATTLDRLATAQEAAGRPGEALATATRAIELAESRARRRSLGALVERVEAGGGADDAERAAIERAAIERATALLVVVAAGPDGGRPEDGPGGALAPDAAPRPATTAEPEPPPPPEPPPDPLALLAEAEANLRSGEGSRAFALLLEAVPVLAASGRSEAALDAAYQALTIAPEDPGPQLALIALYHDRGWEALAAEKARLLARRAELDGDPATLARIPAAPARPVPAP